MEFQCKRLDMKTGKLCAKKFQRDWNLTRHYDMHDRQEEDDYAELERTLGNTQIKYNDKHIYTNEHAIALFDWFPKTSVHTLLFPTSTAHNQLAPFQAFQDPEFLTLIRNEVAKLKKIVASELQRKYGRYSLQDRPREAVLNGEVDIADNGELPQGRDWEQEVIAGVLAMPSMKRLHVHVLSVDRISSGLMNQTHYNRFTTPFFIHLSEFPLPKKDVDARVPAYLKSELKCWRCGQRFGDDFILLKEHLITEFNQWKGL